jgi:hypothetical protein
MIIHIIIHIEEQVKRGLVAVSQLCNAHLRNPTYRIAHLRESPSLSAFVAGHHGEADLEEVIVLQDQLGGFEVRSLRRMARRLPPPQHSAEDEDDEQSPPHDLPDPIGWLCRFWLRWQNRCLLR